MKVLMINGSPRPNGNTSLALREMETVFTAEGIETEIVQVGNKAIRGCIACGKCAKVCPQNIDIPGAMKGLVEECAKLPSWADISRQREEEARQARLR